MTRAQVRSIAHSAGTAQCGMPQRLRRWLAAELRTLRGRITVSAAACHAERYRKHFDSFAQACLLLFHGFSGSPSLRQSYEAFADCPGLVAVAGLDTTSTAERLGVSFSQFADSNSSRPAAFLAGLIPELLQRVRQSGLAAEAQFPPELRILDATFVGLSMKLAPWAPRTTRSKRKSGVRLPVQYAPALDLPERFLITTNPHDGRGMDALLLDDPLRLAELQGQTLAIDLGYYAHRRLARLRQAGIHWVIPRHATATLTILENLAVQQGLPGVDEGRSTVLSDQRVQVGSPHNRAGKVLRDLRLVMARVKPLVKAARLGAEPVLYQLLTDRWDLSAAEVVQMYLWRWQIELFFRWLKSHVRLSRILGYSRNAIELTVALAILVHLLTVLAARALGLCRRSPALIRRLGWAFAQITPDHLEAAPEPLVQWLLPGLGPPCHIV